jgi:DNA-directed RNA polymerase subunit RPC12/RpoP
MKTRKRMHACRHCPSAPVVRDVVSGWREQWMRALTGRRPYRCLDCGRRFFDRPIRNCASPLRPRLTAAVSYAR